MPAVSAGRRARWLRAQGSVALVDAEGNLAQRWDKTKQEGMDPAAAIKLPDPKKIVSLATLTDAEGRVVQQWSREKPDDAVREQAWHEFAEEPGNHDPVSSVFLAMCLKIAYEREPRVTIDDSPRLYHYHRFGSVLLGVHHARVCGRW